MLCHETDSVLISTATRSSADVVSLKGCQSNEKFLHKYLCKGSVFKHECGNSIPETLYRYGNRIYANQ